MTQLKPVMIDVGLLATILVLSWLCLVHITVALKPPTACNRPRTFDKPGQINVTSDSNSLGNHHAYCEYFIQAPENNYIVLNFTSIYGFGPHRAQTSQSSGCRHRLQITEVMAGGAERSMQIYCVEKNKVLAPRVFQSNTHLIKLNFSWQPGHYSGFSLAFGFHIAKDRCAYRCKDNNCLPDAALECNGVVECYDSSDELDCPPTSPASGGATTSFSQVIIIIVIVIALAIVVILCLLLLRHVRRHRDTSIEHDQLQADPTPQPQDSLVVYVPSSQSKERQEARLREKQALLRANGTDMDINMPPSIPISEDGEEGYAQSQRELQRPFLAGIGRESILRPPPNRTIYQRESPPPYRMGTQLDCASPCAALANQTDRTHAPACREGGPFRVRCYSANISSHPRNSNLKSNMPNCTSACCIRNTTTTNNPQPCGCHGNSCYVGLRGQPSGAHASHRSRTGRSSSDPQSVGHSRSGSTSSTSIHSTSRGPTHFGPPPEYSAVVGGDSSDIGLLDNQSLRPHSDSSL